ncbi:MAG: hypothetical protein U1A78_19130 [Polyangia bacterium]
MKRTARTFAKQGVRLLEAALQQTPPPGVRAEDVATFFAQNRAQLTLELAALLDQPAATASAGPACGCRHEKTASRPTERRKKR